MAVHESFNAGDFMLEDLEDEELESSSVLGSGFCKFLASFDCFTESQLCIPEDSIEDLEWFPSFTDDYISLSGVPATPELETISFSNFPTTPEHKTEDNNRGLSRGCDGWVRPVIPFKKPRSKRVCSRVSSRSPFSSPESQVTGPVMGKRCTHCLAEKTPQWRMGPMGPKTLCNACGVRFKSGRLVPEYRPASSPSFNRTLHSNSHKKIMKMRTVRDG